MNSATDQGVITLANGSYTLSSAISLNNRNGITIICASIGGCTDNGTGNTFTNDFCAADKTNLIRISGIHFTGSPGTAKIWFYCNHNLTQVRIDHNEFDNIGTSAIAILFGETSSSSRIMGVVDHDNCHGTNNFMCMKNIGGNDTWFTGLQGSANNLFFEDNTCNFTNMPDNGTGCVDAWRGNGTVVRFNTMFNGRLVNHSYCHGGPISSENYGNTINTPGDSPAQFRNIHMQGSGEEIIFGNTVEIASGGSTITIQHFRGDPSTATSEGSCNSLCDGTATGSGADPAHANDGNRAGQSGYACWHQPGRDMNATLKPVYVFMNHSAAGTKVDSVLASGGNAPSQFVSDRDVYNAVSANAQTSSTSPFNGTTGVGFGTLANRPTTCTPTPQAADAGKGGVGYWVTDRGSWNTLLPANTSGRLDVCTATNTWTDGYYTPYTYPHPLVGGSPAGASVKGSVAASGSVVLR